MSKLRSFVLLAVTLLGFTAKAAIPTTNSITVKWSAPGDDGTAGRAYRYDVRYSLYPIDSSNWNQAARATIMPLPAQPGTFQTCTVSGLNFSTTYYFRMKTADENYNWSGLSNQAKVTTCGGVCVGLSGNVDCSPDNGVDIGDLVTLIDYCYINPDPMCICLANANVDGDPAFRIDIGDIAALIAYLYLFNGQLSPCTVPIASDPPAAPIQTVSVH